MSKEKVLIHHQHLEERETHIVQIMMSSYKCDRMMSTKVREIKKERKKEGSRAWNISLQLLKTKGDKKTDLPFVFAKFISFSLLLSWSQMTGHSLFVEGKKSSNTLYEIGTANHNVSDFVHRWWQLITCWIIITQMRMFNKSF